MGMYSRLGNDLYTGKKSVDFVGRKWLWYAMSVVIIGVAVLGLATRGLDYGIEFTGGSQFKISDVPGGSTQEDADRLREDLADSGIEGASAPSVTTSGDSGLLVQVDELAQEDAAAVVDLLVTTLALDRSQVSQEKIGASWGDEIRDRAFIGLIVFLVLVVLFIWAYFRQWKMSLAALVALAHDVVITVGVYSLSGFEVTPATVTGVLTILGFSLYDTVVVFDKVRENTKNLRQAKMSYATAANLALNQTLVRSVNTSLVALIPVGAILYVGAVQLGASSLKDLALALFVGMAAGTYSSVFIATPLLVHLKSRETEVVLAERRAKARERRAADRYAAVPSFSEDMPIFGEDAALEDDLDDLDLDQIEVERPSARARGPEPVGRGRVAPTTTRPTNDGAAAGRPQPSRKPRSQRKK